MRELPRQELEAYIEKYYIPLILNIERGEYTEMLRTAVDFDKNIREIKPGFGVDCCEHKLELAVMSRPFELKMSFRRLTPEISCEVIIWHNCEEGVIRAYPLSLLSSLSFIDRLRHPEELSLTAEEFFKISAELKVASTSHGLSITTPLAKLKGLAYNFANNLPDSVRVPLIQCVTEYSVNARDALEVKRIEPLYNAEQRLMEAWFRILIERHATYEQLSRRAKY